MSARPARLPGLVNAAAAVVLLIVLAAIALRAAATATPSIAEFAPQAQKPISQAPAEQTGALGNGAGGAGGGGLPSPSPAASPTPLPGDVVFRQCVGDPPRQIEDPQSPPCVPYWAGNNGGATSKGVTGTDITIVDPQANPNWADPAEKTTQIDDALQRFFNKRFEMYGRQIHIDQTGSCFQTNNQNSAAGMQASAVCVDEHAKAFASTDYLQTGGVFYYQELATHKVLATITTAPNYDENLLEQYHPYLWQYPPSTDRIFTTLGRWICSELAGGNAVYAPDPLVNTKPRRFGIVFQQILDYGDVTTQPLLNALSACGVTPATQAQWCSNCNEAADPGNSANAVAQMRAAGVTSVICVCNTLDSGLLPQAASKQGWHPEWIVSSYYYTDSMLFMTEAGGGIRDELAGAFGLRFYPKAVGWSDNPAAWAVSAEAPSYPAMPAPTMWYLTELYRSLLMLASGIQMAGPNLNPSSFESGLQRTVFPNPDTSIRAGHVGLRGPIGPVYSFMQDAAEIYWSNTAGSSGAWCYVDGGTRHPIDAPWKPAGKPFQGVCDPAGYSE